MAMTCHDGPNLAPLTEQHHTALSLAWRTFDLVGVTERFDEFFLLLTDLVTSPHTAWSTILLQSGESSKQQSRFPALINI